MSPCLFLCRLHRRTIRHSTLSKRKLVATGKVVATQTQGDADVAQEFAVIALSGLAAELRLSSIGLAKKPNKECSENDYEFARQQLTNAGQAAGDLRKYEEEARRLVEDNWRDIEAVAALLLRNPVGSIDAVDIVDLITKTSANIST